MTHSIKLWLGIFLTLIVSLQFSGSLSTGLVNYLSFEISDLLFGIAPVSLLGFFALLSTLIASLCGGRHYNFRSLTGVLIFIFLLSVTLIYVEEGNFQFRYLLMLNSVILLSSAIASLLEDDQGDLQRILLITCLILSCLGIYQHFVGLEESSLLASREGDVYLAAKLREGLILGSFSYSNHFASFMLLIMPSSLYLVYNQYKEVKFGRRLLYLTFALCMIYAFVLIKSRAAYFALAFTAVVYFLVYSRFSFKFKLLLGLSSVMIFVLLLLLLFKMDKLASIGTRFFYYKVCIEMFLSHPFKPLGLGSFYPEYMRLKEAGLEETRFPHSIFFALVAQFGVWGMLIYFSLLKVLIGFFQKKYKGAQAAVVFALSAWFVHAHLDYVIYSPAILVMLFLLIIYLKPVSSFGSKVSTTEAYLWKIVTICLLSVSCFSVYQFWVEQKITDFIDELSEHQQKSPNALKIKLKRLEKIQIVDDPELAEFVARVSLNHSEYFDRQAKSLLAQEYLSLAKLIYSENLHKTAARHVFFRGLSEVYKREKSYEGAYLAIKRSLEYYPFSPLSLKKEEEILSLKRAKKRHFLVNQLKRSLVTFQSLLFEKYFRSLSTEQEEELLELRGGLSHALKGLSLDDDTRQNCERALSIAF